MTTNTDVDAREALAERLVDDVTRSLETLSVYLGLELGLYHTLSDLEPATEAEVAARAGIALRYAREWLEQQASAGYVVCDDPTRPAEARRYRLPAVPDIDRRLRTAPPSRVLDLGCGLGASSIALARAYPRARVVGVDLDQASVTEARAEAAEAGVADRVTFVVGDAAHVAFETSFDLITVFEALHDMADPVGTLRAARALLAGDGSVLVADERVADAFTAPGDPVERFMYGWSILHCLAATLAERPAEAAGTVLRAPTVARWATAAGFAGFEVLPIDNLFWRFYRMRG